MTSTRGRLCRARREAEDALREAMQPGPTDLDVEVLRGAISGAEIASVPEETLDGARAALDAATEAQGEARRRRDEIRDEMQAFDVARPLDVDTARLGAAVAGAAELPARFAA